MLLNKIFRLLGYMKFIRYEVRSYHYLNHKYTCHTYLSRIHQIIVNFKLKRMIFISACILYFLLPGNLFDITLDTFAYQ